MVFGSLEKMMDAVAEVDSFGRSSEATWTLTLADPKAVRLAWSRMAPLDRPGQTEHGDRLRRLAVQSHETYGDRTGGGRDRRGDRHPR